MIRNRRRALPPLFTLAALVAFHRALAADVVRWDGGAGTGAWADPANWSTDALPADTDDIQFFEPLRGFLDLHLGADRTVRNVVAAPDWYFEAKRITIGSAPDVSAGHALTLSGGRLELRGTLGRLLVNVDLVLGTDGSIDVTGNTTIAGVIRDDGHGYGLHSTGRLALSAANAYSGPTSSDSAIIFEGPNGSAHNSSSFTLGSLVLDNADGVNNDRINDAATITLLGGSLNLNGHETDSVNEVVGDVIFARGRNSTNANGPASSVLQLRSLTRRNRSVGSVGGPGRILLATPPALVGSGAIGTPGVGIVPFLFGDHYEAVPATYDAGPDATPGNADDVGLRGLRPTELTTLAAAADGDNVRIDGATAQGPIAGRIVNSLSIRNSSSDLPITGTGTLGIRSGLIILNRAGSYGKGIISGFDAVDFGSAEGIIHNAVGDGFTPSFEIASPVRGSGGLTKSGYGGVRLTGPHDYTGTVTIFEGRLDVDHPSGLGSGGDGVILDGGELGIVSSFTTDRHIASGPDGGSVRVDTGITLTLTSPIALDGFLGKHGAGTLVLTAPSEGSRHNFVVGGTVVLANNTGSATGDALLFVQDRSTLAGSGAATGRVTVHRGGRVAPGTADEPAATLTIGELVLRGGSSLQFDLADPQHSDHLLVARDLTLDGSLIVTALDDFGLGTYRLIDYAGSLTDNGLSVRGPADYQYQIDTSTPGQVNLIVLVPEPASVAAVGLVLSLLRRRR